MKRRKTNIMIVLLALLLALFTACEFDGDAAGATGNETASVTVGVRSTRTILPAEFRTPDYYEIILTPHDSVLGAETKTVCTADGSTSVSVELKAGMWDVAINGRVKAGSGQQPATDMVTMKGETLNQTVVLNGDNVITVALEPEYTGKGNVEVTFSWTADAAVGEGPLKDSLKAGETPVSFSVIMKDGRRTDTEEPRTVAGIYSAEARTVKAVFEDVPATKNGRYSFELRDRNDNLVYKTGNIAVQVAAGQTSTANRGSLSGFAITEAPAYASSISLAEPAWKINAEQPGSAIDINVNGKSGVDFIYAYVYKAGTDILSGEVQKIAFAPSTPITVTGLESTDGYDIRLQAHYRNGLMSPVSEFPELMDIRARIAVEKIEITGLPAEGRMGLGDRITLGARITPAEATVQSYRWSTSNDHISFEGDIFTAASLGQTEITVTADDPTTKPTPSAKSGTISVVLNTPETVTAEVGASSIEVSWTAVSGAESYVLMRQKDQEGFVEILPEPETFDPTACMYSDRNIVSGSTYTYAVVATADSKKTGTYDPKSGMMYSLPVEARSSSITIVLPEQVEDLSGLIASGATVTPSDDLTVSLAKPFMDSPLYTWDLDGKELASGTFDQMKTITVHFSDLDLESGSKDHRLSLIATTADGFAYSTEVSFSHPETHVVISSPQGRRIPNDLPASEKASIALIEATSESGFASMLTNPVMTYTTDRPDIANVTADGYLDPVPGAYGKVTVTVRDSYGAVNEITFEVYSPTVHSEQEVKDLIIEVNRSIAPALQEMNARYGGDWWGASEAANAVAGNRAGMTGNVSATSGGLFGRICFGTTGDSTLSSMIKGPFEVSSSAVGPFSVTSPEGLGYRTDHNTWGIAAKNGLISIGHTDKNSRSECNMLLIDLPYNQGQAKIWYSEVSVNGTGGSYRVEFTKECGSWSNEGGYGLTPSKTGGYTVNNSEVNVKLL